MTPDTITVTARTEVWEAVRDALRASPATSPFYHALTLEVERALEDRTDEYLRRYEGSA